MAGAAQPIVEEGTATRIALVRAHCCIVCMGRRGCDGHDEGGEDEEGTAAHEAKMPRLAGELQRHRAGGAERSRSSAAPAAETTEQVLELFDVQQASGA